MPPAASASTAVLEPDGAASDPLIAARTNFALGRDVAGGKGGGGARSVLARLLEAEYGRRPVAAAGPGAATAVSREDATVAALRKACRLDVPLTPEALLAHERPSPRLAAVLAELWPDAVRWYGPDHCTAVLRSALGADRDASATAFLLDLAASTRLFPLAPEEAADLAGPGRSRPVRHAAWRYLHDVPGGRALLPAASTAADVYERMLLSPPAPSVRWSAGRVGAVVGQTMLLGGLETPGRGPSGGLSVLLGGLGDRLAATPGMAGAVTVVLTGRAGFERTPEVAHERSPGHWVLRLPVDAADVPEQAELHAHRPAISWWATRLLGGLPRRLDVLHVRYADDGSLALAEAAARLGARLVFTATPDPHRHLVERHAHTTPDAAEPLRHDLHRIFVADRLVERADTVVGIPGRGGTGELVRHFPRLAGENGGAGPAAPPEGIAPYQPAPDESRRRRGLLSALFRGGDRPDALDPADRELPLLLSVGRLDPVKQQDLLVRAWLASGLCDASTLVLVGGGPVADSTGAEEGMRRRVDALLAGRPQARRRCALIPAMANDEVRRLERALADPRHGTRSWYVCPSVKEEFGIAVLEAMDAGLPVAAPLRGGVAHYVRDGVNGLLLDTSGAAGLARGLVRVAAVAEEDRAAYARRGRDVARDRYSVAAMADALARHYVTAPAPRRHPSAPEAGGHTGPPGPPFPQAQAAG